MTPRMVEVKNHPRITLYTHSEVESVEGYVGNFEVKIRKKARSVDEDLCTGCGECQTKCPLGKSKTARIASEFDMGLSRRPYLCALPASGAERARHRPGALPLF